MNESETEPRKLFMAIFIDALGWEVLRRHSFLDDILTERMPLETIFGYSSTCDPTILTGCLPKEHRHFAFFAYDPQHSPFRQYWIFRWLPKSLMQRGRVRAKLSQIMKRVHGFTGYFQLYNMPFEHLHLFDYTERNNIFERGGINGGQRTIFDILREKQIPFCRPEGYNEAESVAEVARAIDSATPRFVYLFFGKLDALLHAHGTASPIVSEHIAWYEEQVRQLYAKAKTQYDEVRLCVFSDHGMTDTRETCAIMECIDRTGLSFGVDYAAAYDSTMARFWFLRPGARERIESVLAQESRGHVMSQEELEAYGCLFPDGKYGELFFLANPGVLLCPSHMGVKPLAAMHGYQPHDKDSTAAFLSNVRFDPMPRRLDDLFTLMRDEVAAPSELQR